MAAAEDLWCQGWSEPNAGSDLAASRAGPARVDGGWVLDGQKTWTTRGAFCTHLFGLFRTDPDSERHKGLTYLLVPLDTPGVTVRGFGRLDGDEGFAEVFFDDAFLADDAVPGGVVLGEPEGGWAVAMATAGSERGLTLRSPGRFLATAERLARAAPTSGGDDVLRRRARDALDAGRGLPAADAGRPSPSWPPAAKAGAEASLTKLWWRELDIELHEIALDLLGPDAELEGPWSKGWQFSLSGPIYAGTNEIQRNIAAERAPGAAAPMRFALTDDQVAFRDAVRDLLAKECPPAVVRAAWDAPPASSTAACGTASTPWACSRVLVPEADGGLGLDETLPRADPRGGRPGRPPAPARRDGDGGRARSGVGGRHGRHRPRRARSSPCAADADALLLRSRRRASSRVDRDAVELDAGRRPSTAAAGPAAVAPARHRRARHRRPGRHRAGLRPGRARHRRRARRPRRRRCST